jgi:hypothetical protein
MTDTAPDDALSLMAPVSADALRAWAETPWLMGAFRPGRAMRSASGVRQVSRRTTAFCAMPFWRVVGLALAVWLVCAVGSGQADVPLTSRSPEDWAVEMVFREALQLWADERFEVLWAQGLLTSRYRISREAFVWEMRHRVVKPTCCWGRLPVVRVHLHGTDEALVEALVGVDVKTLGTTVVRSMLVALRREAGVWRVRLEDFLTKPEDGLSGLRGSW